MTIDIMLPYYGDPDLLRIAVDSVLVQSDPDWTLTVVDDVYPDERPGQWVASIDDPRVRYIRNEVNLRPSGNYRKCVGLMQTEFGVIMGCDDQMLPDYIARMHKVIARVAEVDVIQPGVQVIDEHGTVVKPLADRVKTMIRPRPKQTTYLFLQGEAMARTLLTGNWTYFPSLCWRVDLLRQYGFRTDLDVVQDLAMLLDIAADGGTLVYDPVTSFRYRRHSASYSAVTGVDGTKYVQESTLFTESSERFEGLGWNGAARAARWRMLSRVHAMTELPTALRGRDREALALLARHILG